MKDQKNLKMQGTNRKKAYAFADRLTQNGISATVRRTMGADIEGACGQLRAKILNGANTTNNN